MMAAPASAPLASFQARLARLIRKHRRMEAGGVTYKVGRDGLITAHPRGGLGLAFPLRTLALLLLAAVAFKALLLTALGEEAYGSRVAGLAAGSAVERAGAWVMQADPATRMVAGALRDLSF